MQTFNGVKVFSATMQKSRDALGEQITEWLRANPGIAIVDKIVTQSSDEEFHCISITFFYDEETETRHRIKFVRKDGRELTP